MSASRRVYVHQLHAPSSKNLLPLAVGLIASYVKHQPDLAARYACAIKVLREDPALTVRSYDDPDVLAYSTYSWNFRQSLEVARLAKQAHPGVLVVFGGPMIALSQRPDELEVFFKSYPWVDLVVHGMGEWAFADVLRARLAGRTWEGIPGLSYRSPEASVGFTSTTPANFNKDLNELPSPFLDGTFDEVLEEYGERITGALWETNRGCPFTCTFCVQGDAIFKRVLTFETSRLYQELEWMSERRIEYVFATDANFGIKERDLSIAEKIAQLKLAQGDPRFFMVNWMKNSSAKILRTAEALSRGGIPARMTLSRQSFSEETLDAIKRKNIQLSTYDEMKHEAAKQSVASYTELILGLPNDSYESFVSGIEKAMDPHLTHVFIVYLCRLLDGTEMSTIADRQKYQYQTRVCKVGFGRSEYIANGVDELEEIIIGSAAMPTEDWRRAHTFANLALVLYNCRLAFFLFNYLRQEHGVSLRQLLESLIATLEHEPQRFPALAKAMAAIRECQQSILNQGSSLLTLEMTGNLLFEAHEAACVLLLDQLDACYRELWAFVTSRLATEGRAADPTLLRDLFVYQRALIPTWRTPPRQTLSFDWNVPQYVSALCAGREPIVLERCRTVMTVEDKMGAFHDPAEFSRQKLTVAMLKIAEVTTITTAQTTDTQTVEMSSVYDNLEFI
jgi:putative methyltransferase